MQGHKNSQVDLTPENRASKGLSASLLLKLGFKAGACSGPYLLYQKTKRLTLRHISTTQNFNMELSSKISLNLGVALGFSLIVLLLIAQTLVGLLRIANINQHMEQIVTNNNVKTDLVHIMKDSFRERTIITQFVTLLDDPFEKNEEFIRFGEYGEAFIKARNALADMPQGPTEKEVYARHTTMMSKAQGFALQALNLAMEGNVVEARKLITSEVMNAQRQQSEELNQLLAIQKLETEAAVAEAKDAYVKTRWLMFVLGGSASCLGIGVAIVVIRNAKKQTGLLQRQALFDNLTNLPNRMLFDDRLQQINLIASREKQVYAIFAMDLNRFKQINDTHGHHVGDQVLQHAAACIRSCIREVDTVARMGGDEFTILLASVSDTDSAIVVARRIIQVVCEPFELSVGSMEIGVSIGLALYPQHGNDPAELLRKADAAMYVAKQTQSGYRVYSEELGHGIDDQLILQSELRQAIINNELVLHYQPKIEFLTDRVNGVEVLVRWQHPKHGLLAPDKFIPLAEQSGLIKPLTKWVMKTALSQCGAWYRTGVSLSMAVNVSAISIHDPEFPSQMEQLLKEYMVPATQLELEITESVVMSDPQRAVECIGKLSALGVQIAIDDFGTGYSSMAYLKDMLVAKIKIDKSFVKNLAVNHTDSVIVRSTVELGHKLGLKVVAEGVEDQMAWEKLKGLGCDSAQGYYMSRPLPSVEFMDWLQKSQWKLQVKDT